MIWIDIDMPKNCMCCPFPSVGTDYYYCHCPGVDERAYDFKQAESIPDDCPLHEVTDPDTVSRQAVLDAIMKKPAWHNSEGSFYHSADIKDAVNNLPPSPTPTPRRRRRRHTASLETPCDHCYFFTHKCTYPGKCADRAIWEAAHEGGAV